ncbi:MAG: DNA repair protein RecN, partial [Microbacterium sp.]
MTLVSLRVRELATIADATLELGPGLNVLTGETGAGKSMLVDALALLLGDRADRAAVRPGAARMVVEGVFDAPPAAARARLESAGLDAEDPLVIRREVSAEGRSRAWINGSPTTIGVLATLGEVLCDLHGQHQSLQLLDASAQRELLDAFGDATPQARAVRTAWHELDALRSEQRDLQARRDEAQRRADWLRHVVVEIDAVAPRVDEEAGLDREATRLGQATTLAEHARAIADALDGEEGSARTAIGRAERALNALERGDPDAGSWRELLDGAYAQLDELSRVASEYADSLEEDPDRLAQLERRRDLLFALRRKHGETIADVLATRNAAAAELDLIDTADLDLRTLAARIAAAEAAHATLCADLGTRRRRAAGRMGRDVTGHLPGLGLPAGEFLVRVEPLPAPGPDGGDAVSFDVRLNRGIDPRPLARTASGGELSRLMLALKLVLAKHDNVPTLVFDEVDQGVGGEVGTRLGDALARVAERHQVLVITHLPQIAARASRHLRIEKATR